MVMKMTAMMITTTILSLNENNTVTYYFRVHFLWSFKTWNHLRAIVYKTVFILIYTNLHVDTLSWFSSLTLHKTKSVGFSVLRCVL